MRFTHEDPDTLEVGTRTGFRVAHVFDLAPVDPLPGTDTSAFSTHFADSRAAELARDRHDTRALQHYLGLENIAHTVRSTDLAPDRVKSFWRA